MLNRNLFMYIIIYIHIYIYHFAYIRIIISNVFFLS